MSLDARVRYTKMVIKDSFISLILEKPFHSITLKEVCALAGINRSTFYKHYRDVYDWRDQLERALMEAEEELISKGGEAEDITDMLTAEFENMRKDQALYHAITSPNFESDIMGRLLAAVLEKTDEETRKYYSNGVKDCQRRWDYHYMIKGCIGALECWVSEGMEEEPRAIAEFCAGKIYSSGARPRT